MIVKRDGLGFEAVGDTLRITSYAYDAGPVHLSRDDLAVLGLAVRPRALRASASAVKLWREAARHARDEIPRGPAPWGSPGIVAGDIRLVAVTEGLDVFVLAYDASPIEVQRTELEQLGVCRSRH